MHGRTSWWKSSTALSTEVCPFCKNPCVTDNDLPTSSSYRKQLVIYVCNAGATFVRAGRANRLLGADFKLDATRVYTSLAAHFFEGLNYAIIEASRLVASEVAHVALFTPIGDPLLGYLYAIVFHDRKLLPLASGRYSPAPIPIRVRCKPRKVYVLLPKRDRPFLVRGCYKDPARC